MPDDIDALAPLDDLDAQILADLRTLHDLVDPVPPGLADRVKFALTVQALHAEVAELTSSALLTRSDGDRGLGTADATGTDAGDPSSPGTITFTTPTLSIMISVSPEADGLVRIDGWVTAGGAQVELVTERPPRIVVADPHGRFVLDRVAPGPTRFVVRRDPDDPGCRPVLTPTFTI